MKLERKDIELLSPVGSWESLTSAMQGGADAVYFGVEQLNMRAKSSFNFTKNDLPRLVEISKKKNTKTYLTLNTVLYDHELDDIIEIIDLAKKYSVDGIIASDQSVIGYAYEQKVEVHLSTQLNISNIESVKFYSKYADVIVLARELNLDQVKYISSKIRDLNIKGPGGQLIRLELFAHGALCMSISGKCYLSLHEYNQSANRGECLQLCRRSYTVTDNESGNQLTIDNQYIMSPKDLMTIHFLNKILDSGVRVLKIEGRARSPEYVKTVTACYNEAIHSVIADTYSTENISSWKKRLAEVFNRGFWDGYYLGQKLGEWSHTYGSGATIRKLYCGKITNYFEKSRVAEIIVESGEFNINDEIIIIGPTTGVVEETISEIRRDNISVEKAGKGSTCTILFKNLVRRSDKVYKLVSVAENKTG